MKKYRIVFGIASVLCILALFAGPASAVFANRTTGESRPCIDRLAEQGFDVNAIGSAVENGDNETACTFLQQFMRDQGVNSSHPNRGARITNMTGMLDKLEEQGIDVSEIRTALGKGDQETARTLLRHLMEEERGTLPAPREGKQPGMNMTVLVERLEEQGLDVSEIQAAIENGDDETARTLVQQLLAEYRDILPTAPEGRGLGMNVSGHLDTLEERGYDVSEIRTALENGDQQTARTLLQQFMEEYRDEFAQRPRNGCRGAFGDHGMRVTGE